MAALTANRSTPRMGDTASPDLLSIPVKAAEKIFQHALVVIDAGYAAEGRTALALIAVGRAEALADNTLGASGAINVEVRQGTFKWGNLGADPVVQADVGKDCFVTDDQTVSKTDGGGTKSRAGKVVQLDADGVWVNSGLHV
jgi:hypothetical protein